jgi:hypothetical protein
VLLLRLLAPVCSPAPADTLSRFQNLRSHRGHASAAPFGLSVCKMATAVWRVLLRSTCLSLAREDRSFSAGSVAPSLSIVGQRFGRK